MDQDEAVVSTNNDAALCKYQAVSKHYYKDVFLEHFLNLRLVKTAQTKPPEINRGYYIRSTAIAFIVESFLLKNPDCQIISLGAGYDSLYWRLNSKGFVNDCVYVEIDMAPVVQFKSVAIRKSSVLQEKLSNIRKEDEHLHSDKYHLLSIDLRQICKESTNQTLFVKCGLSQDKPTLCISECVLVYMPTSDSDSVIKFFSFNFSNLTMLNYEQCNMKDKFGKIMMDNMNARHCDLMGVEACESLDSQMLRFTSNNLNHTRAWTLAEIYHELIAKSEIERIEGIEFLDERELLDQLLDHYCIIIASNNQIDWIADNEYWLSKSII